MSEPDRIGSQPHWERAINLAERGRGMASPNPVVGAVLVKEGEVIGEGYHAEYGALHAERSALADAGLKGNDPRGATMFVTLEPCAHHGKQPPCTDAIIAAGVASVVVGSGDPSRKANGLGTRLLREAGVNVLAAPPEVRSRLEAMNQPFRKHSRTGRPWVMLKLAASLDGKVATRSGDSKWISGEESRRLVHGLRAELDAVAVGSGTAVADDPRLTAREVEGRQPTRVVFDSRARLASDAALFEDLQDAPVTVVCGARAPQAEVQRLRARGATVHVVEGDEPAARFAAAMDALGADGLTSVLLEGGPTLAGAALDAGEVDRLELFYAPLVIGGGTPMTRGLGPEKVAEAARLQDVAVTRVGQDVRMSATLRSW